MLKMGKLYIAIEEGECVKIKFKVKIVEIELNFRFPNQIRKNIWDSFQGG